MAVLGILIWSVLSLVWVIPENYDPLMVCWCLLTALTHLAAFVALFFRKKPAAGGYRK